MILSKISLVNFRNYRRLNLKFGNNINIFVGNNAQGKTNILESIYLLAITKSHRYGLDQNLIRFGEEKCRVKGTVQIDKIVRDLEIDITSQKKRVFLNQTEIRKISDYITNFNVILFTPDDLDIIKGSPQIRRNLLNIEISQLSKKYIQYQNEYNKLLKNRNEYLKLIYTNHIADQSYLAILTDRLIERAVLIYQYRKQFIDHINQQISTIFQQLTTQKQLCIHYESNIDLSDLSSSHLKEELKKKFHQYEKREITQGSTLIGPHRDDFSFWLHGKDLKIFGSQGLQRLAVISFKLSEIPIFYQEVGSYPVLLLDDIFSEIDRKKKNRLLKYIDHDIQTIITTTDLKDIQSKTLKEAKIFDVRGGIVTERTGKENGKIT